MRLLVLHASLISVLLPASLEDVHPVQWCGQRFASQTCWSSWTGNMLALRSCQARGLH